MIGSDVISVSRFAPTAAPSYARGVEDGLLAGALATPLAFLDGFAYLHPAAGDTGSKLESILALITQLAPLISAIAPQFAPVIAAITTLVPLVIQIINLFKKPSASFDGALRPVTA